MHLSQFLVRLGASLICVFGIANANYAITDTYDHTNFFKQFDFFNGADPTHGFVKFAASASIANSSGLAGISNNAVYLGVDSTTVNPAGGRGAVRVTSKKAYTHGLIIADIVHMPGGICGVWPAFWTVGPNWPASGEIDIIEGVNDASTDSVTLHTSAGCSMSSAGSLAGTTLANANCNADTAFTGCSMSTANTQGYGKGFNAIGGGVYATQWESTGIYVWFFPRSAIPSDITSGSPNPANWGTPTATFSSGGSGCNVDQHFMNHQIVFDTTFCGDWAGASGVWGESCQKSTGAATCQDFVAANPTAFDEAYWSINSVKVYSLGAAKRDLGVPMPFVA
jgi:Glycosyl hydrolases family 16